MSLGNGLDFLYHCWHGLEDVPAVREVPSEENDDMVGLSIELVPRSARSPPPVCVIEWK